MRDKKNTGDTFTETEQAELEPNFEDTPWGEKSKALDLLMGQSRVLKFESVVTKLNPQIAQFENECSLSVTHNASQWQTIRLSPIEARFVISKLQSYLLSLEPEKKNLDDYLHMTLRDLLTMVKETDAGNVSIVLSEAKTGAPMNVLVLTDGQEISQKLIEFLEEEKN